MATMNISLPDEMKAFVEEQVATGLFANASDYVRDVLRDRMWIEHSGGTPWTPASLTAALEAGEASGISSRSLDEIIEAAMNAPL